jgi:hypothetical protein
LEHEVRFLKGDSDLAIRFNTQLVLLKNKQRQLHQSIIDNLKVALQTKYDQDDDVNLNSFGFPNDDPSLIATDLFKIGAVMINPFSPSPHCQISEFLDVFFSICVLKHYSN